MEKGTVRWAKTGEHWSFPQGLHSRDQNPRIIPHHDSPAFKVKLFKKWKRKKDCSLTEALSPQMQLKLLFISNASHDYVRRWMSPMSRWISNLPLILSASCPCRLSGRFKARGISAGMICWFVLIYLCKTLLISAWKNIYESTTTFDLISCHDLVKFKVFVADSQEGSGGFFFPTGCWQKSPKQMTLVCLHSIHNEGAFHK